jgi:Type II secretion system (T2SS), protein E, N-terminal domain
LASIVELLVKIQILDERQHDAVMSRSKSPSGGHIVQQVAELGYATEGTIARAISVEMGLPRIDLAMTPPEGAALALLDARTCADRFLLPVALRENGELLWLAMADPTDQEAIELVRRKAQKRVRPAVAGPTEILRAVRTLYAAPGAGSSQPEKVRKDKLAAIEIESVQEETPFEVLNVADDIGGTPISKIAKELGVEVPPDLPSRGHMDIREKAGNEIPPKTDPPPPPASLEELFARGTKTGPIETDDLSEADGPTLEALRASLEKGALVLRTVAELCVEKGVFTREEFKKRKPPTNPVKPS